MIPTVRAVALQARTVHVVASVPNSPRHPVAKTTVPQPQGTSSLPTWQRHRDILLSSSAKPSFPAKATSSSPDDARPTVQSNTTTSTCAR